MSSSLRLRLAALAIIVLLCEAASSSGFFYRGVLPSLPSIATALAGLLAAPGFWADIGVTTFEIVCALLIGGTLGAVCGVVVGGGSLLRRAYEPALHYLAPTPKIVFLPILIALCGVGPSSKIAMGALSCFFPLALSVASGMAQTRCIFASRAASACPACARSARWCCRHSSARSRPGCGWGWVWR